MNIRFAQASDLEACFALDPSFETDYVWQMETSRAPNVINLGFRVTRLPRPMRVAATLTKELVADHFERGECFLVAEEDGVVRAFLDMTVDRWKRMGWLHNVVVTSERRRRGVGASLTRQALTWARDQDLKSIMAELPTKNHPAGALLQKMGFAFCGFNDRYYASRDIAIFFSTTIKNG